MWRCARCVADAVTRRHQKVRAILRAEAGGRCVVCGYDRCGHNLVFHHVRPADKAFGMSAASGKSLAAYRAEARKCILVCANCHGEIETGLIPCPSVTRPVEPSAEHGVPRAPTDGDEDHDPARRGSASPQFELD